MGVQGVNNYKNGRTFILTHAKAYAEIALQISLISVLPVNWNLILPTPDT